MYLLLDTSATNNNFFITMYFIYRILRQAEIYQIFGIFKE